MVVSGCSKDTDNVGENMIVLRKRIYVLKMAEEKYEEPSGWMEWERRWGCCC